MVVIYLAYYAFGVFFKPVLEDFGWTRALTSGAFSLSWIVHAALAIAMGSLNDRFGPRLVVTLSGLLLGLGYLLMSQTSALWHLYLFYGVIIGAGMSGGFVPLTSTVARWFARKRNIMTGIVVAGTGVGALIGPPLAARLIYAYNWRTSYVILGIIVLVAVVLAAQLLKRDPARVGQRPYGEIRGEANEIELEARAFTLKHVVCTGQFWVATGVFLCFGFCVFVIMVHIVAHATELGITPTSAANILATIGGLSVVGKVVMGSAADKIGNRQVFMIAFALMSAALFWLLSATQAWMLYLFAVVFGFAFGGCAASESPLIAWLFGLASHGLILGVANVGFCLGAAIGPFLAGYIFDVTGSYGLAFLISACVGVAGLILSAVLAPIGAKRGKSEAA